MSTPSKNCRPGISGDGSKDSAASASAIQYFRNFEIRQIKTALPSEIPKKNLAVSKVEFNEIIFFVEIVNLIIILTTWFSK